MTPEQRNWWRIALELKLRKCHGDAFQEFFSVLMAECHGSDFIRVRAFGQLGDKGCDGYLQSSGKVFACYGALNGDGGKVAYLIGKMGDDYDKANKAIPEIMNEWHMVHNLVDGLPIDAVTKLKALEKADSTRKFGFIGMEGFEQILFSLKLHQIEKLLGPAATSQDAQNFQTAELRDLIAAVMDGTEAPIDITKIKPVPPDKLNFNNLPGHWQSMIMGGWQNTHLVVEYLDRHPDALTGEKIAESFHVRYQYLKAQSLEPGAIMSVLYEGVTGVGSVPPARQVAAQALLAHLFESCDIFESVAIEAVAL